MKRRLMSFVLAAVMVMTMLPGMVLESEAAFLSALDTALLESNSKMQNVLAVRSVDLNVAALDGKKVKSATQELGFSVLEQDYRASELDEDRAGYTLAKKTIKANGKEKHVYLLVIRGTYETGEWLSNFFFTVSDAVPAHTGFEGAKTQVLKALINHVNADEKENNILWVTGHSRGAAVANLVAATFQDGDKGLFKQDAVHAYTFACPNTTRKPNSALNIYNFNFNEDIVPTVPLSTWGYGRNGKTYTTDYRKWSGRLLASWGKDAKDIILFEINTAFPSPGRYSRFITTLRYQHEKPLLNVFELFGDKKWLEGIDAALLVVAEASEDAFWGALIEGVNLVSLTSALTHAATQVDGIVDAHLIEGYQTWIRKAYPFEENTGTSDASDSSTDTLSLSGATYPTSLSVGQWFILQGTVTSANSKITAVTAGVFNSSGKMVTGKTAAPNSKRYNIHDLDNDVLFDSLSAGTYSYIIRATNASGTKELLNKTFTVGSGSSSDTLSISGATYPTSLSVGQWFALKGTVTSSVSNITSLTAGAFDSAGNMKTGNSVSPNSKSYNIVNIDPDVHFDWLPAGTYSYIIRATNAGGEKELLNKIFTVGGGSSGSGSTIDASGRYSVTNTRNITGQDIVATARQWANEGATYWSHYEPWLPSIYWRTGYTYNGQQSFDCSGFVSRVLNDCGLRSGNYTPPYGDCILSQQYGSGFMSIQIEDLVNYGTDITAAVKRAKNGDYSGLQPGDLIAWTSGSLGRHIIIYAGMKNGTPWTVEFTGGGYRDRAMPAEYQSAFQFGARLVSDAGAACSEHTKGEFLFYEGVHPHYNYYACASCGAKFTDGSFTKLSDCSACTSACTNHVKGMYSHCETEHPHYIYYYCNNCEELFKSTSTTKLDNCEICNPKSTPGFSDVREGQWYYDAVQYVMENGIMSGYNTTTFGTNDNLSRAMVVQVLYNKEGQPAISGKHKFPDVPSSQWYNNAVTWASQRSVVGGYGDGRFGPDDSVTLEQVAVILWNYSKNPAGAGSLSGIKGQYSDWAANALRWCAGKGILNNVPYSNATEKATRAQTAQILTNFLSMPETKTLSLVAGGPSGTWFNMGYILQSILNSELSQSQLAITPSSGSIDNIHKIENGEADLAFVSADLVKDAHNGKNSFSSGKETSALWVAGLYPEAVQLVATPDITDVSQLRGKVVCVGETGSSTYNIASRILAEYGLSMKDIKAVNGSFQDGIEGIKDGKVDAAITVAFTPTSAITELASAHDFSLVPLTGFGGDDLIPFTLPAGTYNGIDRKTDCVAVQSALVASEDVPEEVVYELLKAIFDNESALKNAYNRFKSLDVDQAALNSVSMHPGAQKYYREIGILK